MKKQAKRIVSLVLAFAMLALCALTFASCGEKDYVYVTIADEKGNIVVAYEKVYPKELTADAALSAAHEKFYEGGSDGYASAESSYGLSLTKLWGVENGGSYGYYVNNVSPSSLADAVAVGDHIYAFVYTDLETFGDKYSYFNIKTGEASRGSTFEIELTYLDYDENWNIVKKAAAGAYITIDGDRTEFVTDENGKAHVKIAEKGEYVISAKGKNVTLTPPIAIITVE